MTSFKNLEQRMAHAYIETFPPFVALENDEVSVQSQEQYYRFMKQLYQVIYDSPELLFNTLHEDDAYPNRFNKSSYGKPELYNHMKKALAEIDGLVRLLYSFGQSGRVEAGRLVLAEPVKIKKKYLAILLRLGMALEGDELSGERFEGMFPAWKWMAERESDGFVPFSRCMFDPSYPYMQEVYCTLFGPEQAFQKLAQSLEEKGYTRVEVQRGPYALDFVKQTRPGDFPLGSPLFGDPYHYGISFDYRPDAAVPQYLVLRVIGMKDMLLAFERMPPGLKSFIIQHAKQCDDCKYCTQTDKTGKRKRASIEVTSSGVYSLCPLYPGFQFCFTRLDEDLAEDLVAFLEFMESLMAL